MRRSMSDMLQLVVQPGDSPCGTLRVLSLPECCESRRQAKGCSEVRAATFWSALTCQRFGRSRPVAATVSLSLSNPRRQAASVQSADRSAHSKKLPASLDQSFLQLVVEIRDTQQ